jgi:hypothetical protein
LISDGPGLLPPDEMQFSRRPSCSRPHQFSRFHCLTSGSCRSLRLHAPGARPAGRMGHSKLRYQRLSRRRECARNPVSQSPKRRLPRSECTFSAQDPWVS